MYNLPKPYLSHSQVSCYQMCPKQYWYRYIHKQIEEPIFAVLSFGTCYHAAMEFNFRHKLTYLTDRPVEEVVTYFLERWSKCQHAIFEEGQSWAKHVNLGISLVTKYMEDYAPQVNPIMVEQKHEMEIGEGLLFQGVLDLYTTERKVIDFKTAAKAWSSSKARESDQLTGYAMLAFDLTANWPTCTEIHCAVKEGEGSIKVVDGGPRFPYHIDDYKKTLHSTARDISEGIFYKDTSGWICQKDRCPYFTDCMHG